MARSFSRNHSNVLRKSSDDTRHFSVNERDTVDTIQNRKTCESLIKNNTQTAVINIINLRIIYKLDVSYASQHTFSKVTVTIF